ncbi:MAG TPA: protein translocase subunit SecD, partial [Casimicrobiaceae bacterium]|nr:protein translocase subunit SecD [Casimicrobiaceae bacterium]
MNRYPLWKYVIIAVALLVGIVYTVPNFFPEVPAVQVSSSKAGIKIDAALQTTVEDALKAASIPFRGDALDPTGIKVRFADLETQLKAKDILQEKLGANYIVALNLLSASPEWLTAIGAKPMYLGLDLRGGVHFLLQVDMKAALDKAGDRYTTDIRSLLREKKVQYSGVAREGSNVVVRFRDDAERVKARNEIEKAFPDLVLRDADTSGELRLVSGLKPEAQKRIQDGAVQQNITILRNRVNELGVAEPI